MNDFDFSATVERFTGLGSHYDSVRPPAPAALADLLLPLANAKARPHSLLILAVELASQPAIGCHLLNP
jgi:hypothetical protein